jgi:hypothetical protein
MGAIYLRGGIPRHVVGTTAADTVQEWNWPGGVTNHFLFTNAGANPIVLSFTQADADNDVGWLVNAGDILELPAEIGVFYTKSVLGSTFEALVLLRRG